MSKKHSKGKSIKKAAQGGGHAVIQPDASSVQLQRARTTAIAPWHVLRTDNKRLARLNLMRDMLSRLHYAGKKNKLVQPDTNIVFEFTPDCVEAKRLAY